MNATAKAAHTQWIEVPQDRIPAIGSMITALKQILVRDDEGRPLAGFCAGLMRARVVRIGAHWSDPLHGRSGYYVLIEEVAKATGEGRA